MRFRRAVFFTTLYKSMRRFALRAFASLQVFALSCRICVTSCSYLLSSQSHSRPCTPFGCAVRLCHATGLIHNHCISCGLLRASHSRNPTGIRIPRVRASSSYLLPSKPQKASYARFACDESLCGFEELIHLHQMRARKNTDG